MALSKESLSTIGLIFITFLAAIQYLFLQNVPDTVSTFSFLCVTNAIGVLILGVFQFKKIRSITKGGLKKGVILALELTGFNFFMLLGSRSMDAVMISSIVSLYFVFITPLLLLLKKRVNFFSGIATVIAIIALLLMFGADTDALFSSTDVIYLIISDIFFAAYVVSVSLLGENEDALHLSFSQMLFGALFAFVGWVIESMMGHGSLSLPVEISFWISAAFIGIFIRALYGVIQIAAQKYVSALKASLIFAAEIIITLITDPIMCALFHREYTPATIFQVIGCVFFIIATLMVDDTVMARLGFEDLQEDAVSGDPSAAGRSSVTKIITFITLTFSMLTLVSSTIVFLVSIHFIRNSSVENSQKLGENASMTTMTALMNDLEKTITDQVKDKSLLTEQKLEAYSDSTLNAAFFAHALFENSGSYPKKEVEPSLSKNAGKWVMQRNLANRSIHYEDVKAECELLGNMEDVFKPIVQNNDNIATIYLGTEDGLMVSFDPYSDSGGTVGEGYYEHREAQWYQLGKELEVGSYAYTVPYQDGYGRGLTVTCVSPFQDAKGNFAGCVAMDILMRELNASMVNDGIVSPTEATLIDHEGNIIAGNNADPASENLGNIFDPGVNDILNEVGREVLEHKNGITQSGEGEDTYYIAYATINSNDWTLCIVSPVSTVIQPALTIMDSINENTQAVVKTIVQGILNVIQSSLVLCALILILVTLITGKSTKKITQALTKEGEYREK